MNDHLSAERLPHVHELLSEYLDGQLDEVTSQQVEAHLQTCPNCHADYETLRQTVGVLRQLPMRPVPHGFAITASAPPRRGSLFWLRVTNSALAALFIALLAARLVLPGLGQETASRSDTIRVRPVPAEVVSSAVPVAPSSPLRPAAGLAPVGANRSVSTASEETSTTSHAQAAPTAVVAPAAAAPLAAAARSSAASTSSGAAAPTESSSVSPASVRASASTPIQVAAPAQRAPAAGYPVSESAATTVEAVSAWPAWYDPLLIGVGALALLMLGAVILIGRRR